MLCRNSAEILLSSCHIYQSKNNTQCRGFFFLWVNTCRLRPGSLKVYKSLCSFESDKLLFTQVKCATLRPQSLTTSAVRLLFVYSKQPVSSQSIRKYVPVRLRQFRLRVTQNENCCVQSDGFFQIGHAQPLHAAHLNTFCCPIEVFNSLYSFNLYTVETQNFCCQCLQ